MSSCFSNYNVCDYMVRFYEIKRQKDLSYWNINHIQACMLYEYQMVPSFPFSLLSFLIMSQAFKHPNNSVKLGLPTLLMKN